MQESRIYKLFELKGNIEEAISNYGKVIEQQTNLVDTLEKSENKEYFKDFINGIKDSIEQEKKDLEKTKERYNVLTSLLEIYNKQDEPSKFVDYIVTNTFIALGIGDETSNNKIS